MPWKRMEWDRETIPGDVLTSFKKLRSFEMFSVVPMVFNVFMRLSALPDLTELDLPVSRQWQAIPGQSGDGHTTNDLTFRSLGRLSMYGTSMYDLEAVLSTCRFPRLEELLLKSGSGPGGVTLGILLRSIDRFCPHATLKKLRILSGRGQDTVEPGISTANPACLRQLYGFRHLRSVELDMRMRIALDDDAVKEMAMSWPYLERLELSSNDKNLAETAVTVRGLAHFARYCPSLASLTIDVNTTHSPIYTLPCMDLPAKPGDGHCNRVLKRICFPHSPVHADTAEIGAFLFVIFPNLKHINRGVSSEIGQAWLAVEKVLDLLRIVSEWQRHDVPQVAPV
ncbi:uncharacterized protein B0H18DRAFT_636599 [Fomitopsis serialis]|uniref:uncharacterized protein n=1 Tax=Fomitopsis serialis TaxID=139415 RepID=UPI0020087BF0|nr:uncharacterized protein B0H18DRAFT_636599 [Neoantrodia serialis]KAH9919413.1 hypothetical protein B0H18DRAFT_636599 [Neoantrodia serialis]